MLPKSRSLAFPVSIEEIECLARRAYSELAPEYYDERHITSRNFDFLIQLRLATEPWLRTEFTDGIWLEVGCGRSKLSQILPAHVRLVLVDSSIAMLRHSFQEKTRRLEGVTGSAFSLPFQNAVFSGIFASLGDPFTDASYFNEAHRVLRKGGHFIHVVPTVEWGVPLRQAQHVPLDCSHFFRGDHDSFAPSLLRTKAELDSLAAGAGLSQVTIEDLYLPQSLPENQISPDIQLSARVQERSVYEVPILAIVKGSK